MKASTGLMTISQASALISAGKFLNIAGDEEALKQLPKGNWIGGTIPYFMSADGGKIARDQVFVNEIVDMAGPPVIRQYDADSLPQLCRNAPDHGYTILVVPAFGPCHSSFAENAPNYEDMYIKPVVGWVAGVHLDDLGKITPKVANGLTGELSDQHAIAMDIALPPEQFAQIDIVNLFRPGNGDNITFDSTSFAAGACTIDGKPANLAEYLTTHNIDTRLPLVADYCGAMINVSIKAVDAQAGRVEFYAPVFQGLTYRIAAPVTDYVHEFQAALPKIESGITFSCNCILNFLYSDLEGKRTANVTGPITFGEIGYQLLNQTLVYLTISK
jgi:hypothetical protein